MSTALTRATYTISDALIERMILDPAELPGGLAGFQLARSGYLDNHTMAEQGFPGNSAERFATHHSRWGFEMRGASSIDFRATVAMLTVKSADVRRP